VKRYGAKLPLVVGPVVAALGFVLFMKPGSGGSYWTTFFPAILVLGLGMVISVAPLTTTVMNAVEKSWAGIASGINNAVSRAAALVAIAALGFVILQVFNSRLDQRLRSLDVSPDTRHALDVQRIKLAGAVVPADLDPVVREELRKAINDSFVSGFREVVLISAVLAALSGLVACFFIRGSSTAES